MEHICCTSFSPGLGIIAEERAERVNELRAVASGCNWTTAQMNSQWLPHTRPVQDQARPDPMIKEWEFDYIPIQGTMGYC